jgi:RNA polymerase sigma-70 factor (ECF subfamily)
VAELLQLSVAAVNSSLQRARAQVHKLDAEQAESELDDAHAQAMLADYVAAFENYDVDRIVSLLADDAVWEMPPFLSWFRGAESIGGLIRNHCPAERAGDQVMVPVRANGQPAFALYMRDPDGVHRAFQLQVLTVADGRVSYVRSFFDTSLFARFGLPAELSREGRA